MYAIYAFCREVDDIADEPAMLDDKLAGLDAWREELGRIARGTPQTLTGTALHEAWERFGIPLSEAHAMVDGMETDARGGLRAPNWCALQLYCRRVASSVGLMSIRAFGAPDHGAQRFAVVLGEAFQLTNILRDVHEDASIARLYLPEEALFAAGLDPSMPIEALVTDERLAIALNHVAEAADAAYGRAWQEIRQRGRRGLRPALIMAGVYRAYLNRMQERGWQHHAQPVRLAKLSKLVAGLKGAWAQPEALVVKSDRQSRNVPAQ
jgi:phytoene synthase